MQLADSCPRWADCHRELGVRLQQAAQSPCTTHPIPESRATRCGRTRLGVRRSRRRHLQDAPYRGAAFASCEGWLCLYVRIDTSYIHMYILDTYKRAAAAAWASSCPCANAAGSPTLGTLEGVHKLRKQRLKYAIPRRLGTSCLKGPGETAHQVSRGIVEKSGSENGLVTIPRQLPRQSVEATRFSRGSRQTTRLTDWVCLDLAGRRAKLPPLLFLCYPSTSPFPTAKVLHSPRPDSPASSPSSLFIPSSRYQPSCPALCKFCHSVPMPLHWVPHHPASPDGWCPRWHQFAHLDCAVVMLSCGLVGLVLDRLCP